MESVFTQRQTYPQFLRFIFPSIMSMIAISFYTTIDGFFASRFVGPEALASISIIVPFTCLVYGIALMLSSGAGAYVSMKLGERKKAEADGLFSFTVYALTAVSVAVTVVNLIFLEPILRLIGSTDVLMPYTIPYGFVTVLMTLPMMLKLFFEYFARVDGNPNLAFIMSMLGLILNIILDFLFIGPLGMGILGAALGTFASITISGAIGLWYFLSKRSHLKLGKPRVDFPYLGKSCINGASQLLTELSTGVVTFLFNITILKYEGELGVAAVSIIMFLYYFFIAVYMGLSAGAAPIISYSWGAKNTWRNRLVLRHSGISLIWMSALIFLISFWAGPLLIRIFTTDPKVIDIAESGNRLFSLCYLFAGVNVFMAALFTAVGNGAVAALISTLRCLVFASAAIVLLPLAMGVPGTWLAIPLSEFLTFFFAILFFLRYRGSILPEGKKSASISGADLSL